MTMARKFTSARGMRSVMRSMPWSMLMPMRWPSTTSTNSGPTGAPVSEAMIFMASDTGRPAFRPRTMTSMASAKSLRNLFWRRLRILPRNQRGKPIVPTKPQPAAINKGAPRKIGRTVATAPNIPEQTQKVRGVISRPAWAIKVRRVIFFLACLCWSSSAFKDA